MVQTAFCNTFICQMDQVELQGEFKKHNATGWERKMSALQRYRPESIWKNSRDSVGVLDLCFSGVKSASYFKHCFLLLLWEAQAFTQHSGGLQLTKEKISNYCIIYCHIVTWLRLSSIETLFTVHCWPKKYVTRELFLKSLQDSEVLFN